MSDELKEALQEIDGIGPKKSEEIVDVLDEFSLDDEAELVAEAYDYLTDAKTREARRRLERFLE